MDSSNIIATTVTATNTSAPGATLDTSKIIPEAKSGVVLGEQQQVQQILPNEYSLTSSNRRAVSHLADAAWSLQAMLERENYVATIPWDTTQAPGIDLALYNFPEDLLQLDIASVPFKRFRFWRCKNAKIRVQLTANRFLAGRVIVWFQPTMTDKGSVPNVTLSNMVLLQHAWLDPSASTPVDLIIPFNYHKGWVNLERQDVMGQIGISVFNSLAAVTGTTPNVDIKVFMSIEDSEFKVPLPGGVSYTSMRGMRTEAHSGFMDGLDNAFQNLVNSVMPSNIIGDLIGGLLDKPEVPSDPEVIAVKDQAYLSNARGPAFLEKLTLDPAAQQLVDEEHFATNKDEMSIDYLLKKKYSYVGTFSWLQTQAPGDIIYEEAVGPMMNFLNISPGTRMIDYISRLFHFWRGSIQYMFDIVGTQFHEGRLDIIFLPGIDYTITDYKTIQSLYVGSIVVRNGQNAMAVNCPFLSDTPWKQVYYGADVSNEEPDVYRFDDFASGRLQVVVGSSLRAPTTVPGNVFINIFQSAGSDFELCMPSYYNYSLDIAQPVSHRTEPHSGPMGMDMPNLNNTANKQKPINLAPLASKTYDPAVRHFGDKYSSLRELGKRYQLHSVNTLTFTGTADQRAAVIAGQAPIINSIPINGETITGYLRNLTSMYRQFRGPLRFKIRLNSSKNTTDGIESSNHGYVNFLPQPGYQVAATNVQDLDVFFGYDSTVLVNSGSNLPRARFSNTQTAEFEVEFPSNYATQLVPMLGETRVKGDEMQYIGFNLICAVWLTDPDFTNLSKYALEVYISLGDTTHFGGFIGIPQLNAIVIGGASPYPDLWYTPGRKKQNPSLFVNPIRRPVNEEWTDAEEIRKVMEKELRVSREPSRQRKK